MFWAWLTSPSLINSLAGVGSSWAFAPILHEREDALVGGRAVVSFRHISTIEVVGTWQLFFSHKWVCIVDIRWACGVDRPSEKVREAVFLASARVQFVYFALELVNAVASALLSSLALRADVFRDS